MPEEQRKPFRSVGMRMHRFSQTIMRSYLPPPEVRSEPAPIPPVWQAATGMPLLWEAPSTPAPIAPNAAPSPLIDAQPVPAIAAGTTEEDVVKIQYRGHWPQPVPTYL